MKFRRSTPAVAMAGVALLSVFLLGSGVPEDPRPGDRIVALGGGGWLVADGGTVTSGGIDGRVETEAAGRGSRLVDVAIAPDGGWAVVGSSDFASSGTGRSFNQTLRQLQTAGERIRAVALGSGNAYAIAYDGGYATDGIPRAMEDRLSRVAGSVTAMSIGAGGWTIVTRNRHWSTTGASTTPTYREAVDGILKDGGAVSDVALGEGGWIVARADGGFVARGVPSEACTALRELVEGFACIDAADAADLASKVDPDPLNEGTREAIRRNAPRIDPSGSGGETLSSLRVVHEIDRVKVPVGDAEEWTDSEIYMWKFTCVGRLGDPSVNNVAGVKEWGPTDVDVGPDTFFPLGSFGRTSFDLDPRETAAILLVVGEADPATSAAERRSARDWILGEFGWRCNAALDRNFQVADDRRIQETMIRMDRILMHGLERDAREKLLHETGALAGDDDEFVGAYSDWWINADPSSVGGAVADFVPSGDDLERWCGEVEPTWGCLELDGGIEVDSP